MAKTERKGKDAVLVISKMKIVKIQLTEVGCAAVERGAGAASMIDVLYGQMDASAGKAA